MPSTPAAPVTDWGTALMTSLTTALAVFLAAIPRIIGFLVILIIGWLIASAIARLVGVVLRRARFDDIADRAGFTGFIRDMGLNYDASGMLADVVKWFIRLIVLVVAFDSLGLPAISNILNAFVLWLPNLVVALVVLMLAGLAANFVFRVVRGATLESGFGNADLIANLARAAVWVFAVIIAVNQIGVATTLVDTLFIGFVAAMALAFGLAFGLGGRETAGMIVRDWYMRGRAAAPQIEEAARQAQNQAQAQQPTPGREYPEEPRRVA
jgi:hypothetical protein